jgi:large subunit ribosomal protein L4
MVQLALRSALSDRASEGKVVVVDSWPWSAPSTRGAKEALAALGLDGRVLVVLTRSEEDAYKSFRNLPEAQIMIQGELNAYDVLCNDWIVFTTETLPGSSAVHAEATAGGAAAVDDEAVDDEAVDDEPVEAVAEAPADEADEPDDAGDEDESEVEESEDE